MSASTPTTRLDRLKVYVRQRPWWARLALLRAVVRGALADDITTRAAAIAHFGLLSMVPVTLLAVSALGIWLRDAQAQERAIALLAETLPYPEAIANVTKRVVADRGSVGGLGLIALVWLSLRGFVALQRSLDSILRVKHEDRTRSAWASGLVSLTLILLLGVFAYGSMVASAVVTPFLMESRFWLPGGTAYRPVWVAVAGAGVTAVLSVWFMYMLYRLAPSARIQRRSALFGALVAGLLWEGAKVGFTIWYSRYARIDRFYGAMGGLVLVVSWSYLTAWLILLGAEVTDAHAKIVLHATTTEDASDAADDPEAAVPADELERAHLKALPRSEQR